MRLNDYQGNMFNEDGYLIASSFSPHTPSCNKKELEKPRTPQEAPTNRRYTEKNTER